jgi:hypothetical protein
MSSPASYKEKAAIPTIVHPGEQDEDKINLYEHTPHLRFQISTAK